MKELVIDVSHWDGDIDLQEWKDRRGLWGVIIKAGGNEDSLDRYEDSQFERNYQKAVAAGLHIGAYYYTVSTDINECIVDANHFADLLDGHDFDLPCYMDVEDPRQYALSQRDLTDIIEAFCETLKDRKYYAGLYVNGNTWLNLVYTDELRVYANWIAWWKSTWPTEAGDIGMWQQGCIRLSDGDIVFEDTSGYADCDWCAIDYPSLISQGNSTIPTESEGSNMLACIVNCIDDHAGYKAGMQVLWTPMGFEYINHPDSVHLLDDICQYYTGKPLKRVDSSSKAPWIARLEQITISPGEKTYGVIK